MKGPLCSQILTNVLGCRLLVPVGRLAVYGAALMAGIAAGFYPPEREALGQFAAVERVHDLDLETQSHYFENYEIIQELNRSMRQATELPDSLTSQ